MGIPNRTTRSLAMAAAVVLLAIMSALWSVRPAEAIIIVNSKTGMFTLTSQDAVSVYVVNTADQAGIIIVNSIFDSEGNLLARSEPRRVALGQAASFEYTPDLPDGMRMPVRVELTVDGSGRGKGLDFIPTVEVFDRGTGRTSLFVDYIIDDDK
jgi:hypothetical protein